MTRILRLLSLCLLSSLLGLSPAAYAANADDIRAALERELAELDASAAAEPQILSEQENTEVVRPLLQGTISRESYDNPLIQIETSMGSLILELFPREAPKAVENFLELAEGRKEFVDPDTGTLVRKPFYDGLIFHRIIDDFMIQGGSPTGLGDAGPGYVFDDEINARSLGLDKMLVLDEEGYPHPLLGISSQDDFQQKVLSPLYNEMNITSQEELEVNAENIEERLRTMTVQQNLEYTGYQFTEMVISRSPVRGVIAMANTGPNTNGSQFFITLADTEWLTGRYTIFGKVRSGLDVMDNIGSVRVNAQSRPYSDVTIISIRQLEE